MSENIKERHWILAAIAALMVFFQIVENALTGEIGLSIVSLLWLLVAWNALTGNVNAIVWTSKFAVLSQVVIGSFALFLIYDSQSSADSFGASFVGLFMGLAVPTVAWILVLIWARRKISEKQRLNNADHATLHKNERESVVTLDRIEAATNAHVVASTVTEASPSRPLIEDSERKSDFPKAEIAIKYRHDLQNDWREIEELGEKYSKIYKKELEGNPNQDAASLRLKIFELYRSDKAPCKREHLNKIFNELSEFGGKAQEKFLEICAVLDKSMDPELVAQKIKEEFGGMSRRVASELAALEPGLYESTDGILFRVLPDHTFCLIQIDGSELTQYFKDSADFAEAIVDFTKDRELALKK